MVQNANFWGHGNFHDLPHGNFQDLEISMGWTCNFPWNFPGPGNFQGLENSMARSYLIHVKYLGFCPRISNGRPPSHWREAYFEFRDEIENCLLSVSCLETRTRFCPPNLEPRDEIENFVHRILGLETRSRILFPKSRNSRRDRDFLIILPKHISQKKDFSHKRSNITVQPEEEGSRDSQW